MAGHYRIRLLGDLELWLDGQIVPADAWPGRKVRQLLGILATHRHRVVSSDELIEWLWPNLSVESARNSLWVAISRLRRVLEPDIGKHGPFVFLRTESEGYRFGAAGRCEVDVDTFLALVREGQARQQDGQWAAAVDAYLAAQALYRGDYLAQDPYEDWTIHIRERLLETFLALKVDLATCHLALGRYREALEYAQQALDHDRCRESAWRLVMEAHCRQGERDLALRAFAHCRAILADELNVDPLPETLALRERILHAPHTLSLIHI